MTDRNKKNHIFIVGKRYYINFNDEENNTDSLREVNLYADLVRTTDSSDDISLKITTWVSIGCCQTTEDMRRQEQ